MHLHVFMEKRQLRCMATHVQCLMRLPGSERGNAGWSFPIDPRCDLYGLIMIMRRTIMAAAADEMDMSEHEYHISWLI